MILSRSLRLEDYDELAEEVRFVDEIQCQVGPPHPVHGRQHTHRRWEYALAYRALKDVFGAVQRLRIGDFGCGIGLWAPMLLALGHRVTLYEIWTCENEEWFVIQQMESVRRARGLEANWQIRHVAIGDLGDADRDFDAAYCISTLEHIRNERGAFVDLCRSVRPGGLLFLTVDFGSQESEIVMANNAFQRMYTKALMERLVDYAEEEGLGLLGGTADWNYTVPLVHSYSFASIALVKQPGVGVG